VLTSAPHWVELVTQLGLCEAFGHAWLTKRVRPQLAIDTRLQTSAHVETAHVAVRHALKPTALNQATQLHLSVAVFKRLNSVTLPAVDQLATIRPKLCRSATSDHRSLRERCPRW
jgi:hypothetical protein